MRLKKRGECRGTTYFPFANLYRIIPRVLWCIKVSRQPTPIVHNNLPALICSHIKPAACKLGCHIWASNIAPHDFRAHISKRVSFWEYHICDIILYIDKTSVGQCHIGIRICGVAARPNRRNRIWDKLGSTTAAKKNMGRDGVEAGIEQRHQRVPGYLLDCFYIQN